MSSVLFDIDGTLVDTNWFHTVAWSRVFKDAGLNIPMSRIHPLIGMSAGLMLENLLGEAPEELKEAHGKAFLAFVDEVHALPKAADLLRAVHDRGARVVLCTSAQKAHLDPMLKVLDAEDLIDDVVNTDDVGAGKPEPDIFSAALRDGEDPGDVVVVGDTRWDVEAAKKAGLDAVGVLTGGVPRELLLEAGAVAVYEDVADLLAHLDDSPVGKLISE